MREKLFRIFSFFTNNKFYFTTSVVLFFLGIGLFVVKRNWLLVHWVPGYARSVDARERLRQKIVPKKEITCFYWKDDRLLSQKTMFVLRSNKADSVKLIISTWLSLLYEERILEKIVVINSVALEANEQIAYLSFDKKFLDRDWSIQRKWSVINALCKTIMEAELGIQKVTFLVGHQPMNDNHLDFSRPWPVDGFDEV